jgi:16S rRNA (guanine(966)-N(2))-methyltransferase RsmD
LEECVLRIIAGEAKGRKILSPQGRNTRPTSDRVKESLFNILGQEIPGSNVLDLYAGTGNLGLEAISRGASFCLFIDNDRDSIKTVEYNVKLLKYEEHCEVHNNDAVQALNIIGKRNMKFDVIFLDPPYHKNIIPKVVDAVARYGIMSDECIIAAEHDIKDVIPEKILNLSLVKRFIYGNTVLSFYRNMEE